MKRISQWFLVLGLMAVFVVSACAAPEAPAPSPTPTPPPTPTPSPTPTPDREQQLIEGAKKEGELVIWTHSFPNRELVLKPFLEKYPFLEVKTWDARGQEVAAKTVEEAKVGKYTVDVLTAGSEGDFLPSEYWEELLVAYEWPNVRDWPFQPSHNYYKSSDGTSFGTSYNTTMISAAESPKTLEDLNSTKWRGTTVMSSSANESPLFFAYIWGEGGNLNWDKAFSYWQEVMDNVHPSVTRGFDGPLEMQAAGEYGLFIQVSLPRALDYMFKGAPIDIIPTEQIYLMPHPMGIAKNAPHPNAARLWVDYLTSVEGGTHFANSQIVVALNPESAKLARVNMEFAKRGMELMIVPFEFSTEENYEKAGTFWVDELAKDR